MPKIEFVVAKVGMQEDGSIFTESALIEAAESDEKLYYNKQTQELKMVCSLYDLLEENDDRSNN